MKKIILTGMMGAGKSFVGRALSKCLEMEFIDLDEYIEKNQGMTISDIFGKMGENYFREVEKHSFFELKERNNLVIGTGGGIVLDPTNLSSFRENSILIYLEASPEYIYSNIQEDNTRPLLNSKDKMESIVNILEKRKNLYESQCDHKINVSFRNIDEIIKEIIELI